MTETEIAHPRIASREDWLEGRKALLIHEKEAMKHKDRVSAERRRLPMVEIGKDYHFDGPEGQRSLLDLFGEKQQLIVYHFMFEPDAETGCPGCTGLINAIGNLSGLGGRNTTYVLISRAPLAKLEAYKSRKGWKIPWYSSLGSDFNYDFNVTHDESVAPIEYNYQDKAYLEARRGAPIQGEDHGLSVFFRLNDRVFHTYSTYGRGCESLNDSYSLLDLTPYGRQEDWEDSPSGWPQEPTYG